MRLYSAELRSVTASRGRCARSGQRGERSPRRWARPIYIRPCSLLHSHWHSLASLIKRARASHAHAYPLLRAQRTSAHRGDTEAPRMPCCANNTTAHVRDISFYYYPSVRSLPFPLLPSLPLCCSKPLSAIRFLFLVFHSLDLRFFLSLSVSLPSCPVPTLFLLPPALVLLLLSSLSFCSAAARERISMPYSLHLLRTGNDASAAIRHDSIHPRGNAPHAL